MNLMNSVLKMAKNKTCYFEICQRNPLADWEREKTEQCLGYILMQLKTANDLHYDFLKLILTNLQILMSDCSNNLNCKHV